MNSVFKQSATAVALSLALSSQAFAGVSANIGITSDYVWRGWTQNDNKASLSGGLDYEADNGLYVGTWAANVSNDGNDLEVDLYAGYAGETSGGFGYDLGVIAYMYPDATDLDFTEVYASGAYKMFEAGLAATVSADNDAAEGDLYTFLAVGHEFGPISGSFTLGNTSYDADGADDVQHYQLAASYSIPNDMGDLTLAVDRVDDAEDDTITSLSWTKGFDF